MEKSKYLITFSIQMRILLSYISLTSLYSPRKTIKNEKIFIFKKQIFTFFILLAISMANIANANCFINQLQNNNWDNSNDYLVETTKACGFKNANNLSQVISLLGGPDNMEIRSFMRQIEGNGIERYSVIAVTGVKEKNSGFSPRNLIFALGKLDKKQDQLSGFETGNFVLMLDLKGNVLKTLHLEYQNGFRTVSLNKGSFLHNYIQNYWITYFDSVAAGVPKSSEGMDK